MGLTVPGFPIFARSIIAVKPVPIRQGLLEIGQSAGVDIAHHMEVVMVDINHFSRIFVRHRMRQRPANALDFGIVNRALVVGVVLLHGPISG